MLFPQFENIKIINSIREKYDPLATKVRPHITLVFPFESNLLKEKIEDHCRKALSPMRPFKLKMGQAVLMDDGLIFLSVAEGGGEIKRMHRSLYTGVFEQYRPHWLHGAAYLPHMTIGKAANKKSTTKYLEEFNRSGTRFSTIADTVSVEIINADESSIIESEIRL
jgi:2'-5' RNA ligase